MTQLMYVRGTRSADEIQREVDKFWDELADDEELRTELASAGIDAPAVLALKSPDAIRVGVRGAGLDPTTVALVIAFAPVANEMLVSLWKEVLLPRIRSRYGRDAIQDEKPPET
jgi:hypothetical protein